MISQLSRLCIIISIIFTGLLYRCRRMTAECNAIKIPWAFVLRHYFANKEYALTFFRRLHDGCRTLILWLGCLGHSPKLKLKLKVIYSTCCGNINQPTGWLHMHHRDRRHQSDAKHRIAWGIWNICYDREKCNEHSLQVADVINLHRRASFTKLPRTFTSSILCRHVARANDVTWLPWSHSEILWYLRCGKREITSAGCTSVCDRYCDRMEHRILFI